MRSRGVKLRSADHKLAKFKSIRHMLAVAAHDPPTFNPSSDLTPHAPKKHLNQGRSGSCGGHAPAVWLFVAASIAGIALGFDGPPSPRLGYGGARCIEQPGAGPLQDSGVEPADPINAYATMGVAPMRCTLTPDGRYSDIWTAEDVENIPGAPAANDSLRPTAEEDAECAKHLVLGAYTIDPLDPHFVQLVAAALSVGKPVTITAFVDSAFEDWGDNDPTDATPPLAVLPNYADPTGGGHYITILAHKTLQDGSLAFLIWNSWGKDWGVSCTGCPGEQGNIWVSDRWLAAACTEAYAGTLTVKAAA